MEKIVNYVKSGKGNGLIFLLATAVLGTIFMLLILKQVYSDFRPKVVANISEILPITVENGKVVQPLDVYKRVEIKLDELNSENSVFPIVLDTKEAVSELPKEKTGLFVMRDIIYLITPNEIKRINLKDGTWTTESIGEFLDYFSNMISFVVAGVMIVVFFVFALLKTLAAAFISKWGVEYFYKKEQNNWGVFMRLNALLISFIELFSIVIGYYIGIRVGWLGEILLAVLFSLTIFNKKGNLAE